MRFDTSDASACNAVASLYLRESMSGRPCVSVSRGWTREGLVELNADSLTIGRVELNGIRMVRGEAVALKEGDELRIVLKGDMLPKPPQAICAEECKKLKVVFVFHMDADEALPHLPGWRFYKVPPVGGLRECH